MDYINLLANVAPIVFLCLILVEIKFRSAWLNVTKGLIAFAMVMFNLFGHYDLVAAIIWGVLLAIQILLIRNLPQAKQLARKGEK